MPTFVIPGLIPKKVTIENNFLQYGWKKFKYDDVTDFSFATVNYTFSYWFIPVYKSQRYYMKFFSNKKKINIHFSAKYYIGRRRKEYAFNELINYIHSAIEPAILEKIISNTLDKKEGLWIGKIFFNQDGCHKANGKNWDSVFWRGEESLTPMFFDNKLIIWRIKNGERKEFVEIPLDEPKVFLVEGLIKACKTKYGLGS